MADRVESNDNTEPSVTLSWMASIFTFESEPLKVTSPWPTPPIPEINLEDRPPVLPGMTMPRVQSLLCTGITKLDAEPQEGPIEYKLHLLLRPRRSFSSITTVQRVSGSHLSKSATSRSEQREEPKSSNLTPIWAPSSQSRQNRLQHLTTQLIWRLQQSTPYHSTSKSNLVIPILPESDVENSALKGPGPLIPGLETSGGALYEIGVSDDGAFVGLARDELEESLIILRAMAFSIGCNLEVLKLVIVGDCQWIDVSDENIQRINTKIEDKLWVAEVLVTPDMQSHSTAPQMSDLSIQSHSSTSILGSTQVVTPIYEKSCHEQLRISMTGSTTSGKSSLLGTLSTSTLDNGRGKSRLSLLKHRHEIVSGITSSLAQELFGYQDSVTNTKIVNYASGNVTSWDDIHNSSERGRLVFVIDTAGHPRYRRTTVRGLISWAPHWILCCIAADDGDESSGRVGATASSSDVLGAAGIGIDMSKAHLDLCLKLHLPLVIVMTKLDLATKSGLRNVLTNVLSTLKIAGRRPTILSSMSEKVGDVRLNSIASSDTDIVSKAINSVPVLEMHLLVPIVLTSAVTGDGIGRLHALLHELPAPDSQSNDLSTTSKDFEHPEILFHVDEVFAMPANAHEAVSEMTMSSIVLSGYLRYGKIEIGDHLLLGPCTIDIQDTIAEGSNIQPASSCYISTTDSDDGGKKSRFVHQRSSVDIAYPSANLDRHSGHRRVWQEVKVSSLRNLRLPVRILSADQAGTVGLILCNTEFHVERAVALEPCFRRGMVIISMPGDRRLNRPPAYRRFSAVFQEAGLPAWPGVLVIVYIASIRAPAKIVSVKALEAHDPLDEVSEHDDNVDNGNGCEDSVRSQSPIEVQHTEITFEFSSSSEWIELGTQVLVTPGGSPSLTGQPEHRDVASAGLDGYVGKITQAYT